MSFACRASLLVMAAVLALSGCDREERRNRAKPVGDTVPAGGTPGTYVGPVPANLPADPLGRLYENNAHAIAEGQQLFGWMNCVGCHAHGGGGMGPPLMDEEWRYGGQIQQIAATIAEGRPNGMPAWRGRLTEDQIWKLAAFVRSLSGQPRKDAVGGRADELSNTAPLTLTPRQPVRLSDSPAQ